MSIITFTTGMKLLRSKNYESVYTQSIEALRLDETNPLPFFLLGVLASDTGNPTKALEFFAKASEHGPRNVHYQTYHSKALATLGYNDEAKTRADIAATIWTTDAVLADMIGVVYSRTGYHELAIPFFEKAVKKNPRWAKFHFNLGASAEFIGDFKKAKTAYKNVLSIDPKFYLAWFALTALEKQSPDNNQLEKLGTLFDAAYGDADAQLLLGHSIAKTLEDLELYEESFDWLEKGKKTKKEQVQYNKEQIAGVVKAAKTRTKPDSGGGTPAMSKTSTAAPLFVIGLPRTGTTLVDRILSSHAKVHSAGELNVFSKLIKLATGTPVDTQLNAVSFLRTGQINLENVGKDYIAETKGLLLGATHLVDKTPLNFFYAGLIHRALPNSKIIVLRRGAMDSCLSNYRQIFAANNSNFDYSFDVEDTAAFYREFDGLVEHWRGIIPSDRFMEVNYENIVFDQENQTRKLLAFCGLPWDEACMRFHENDTPISTASSVQVRQTLYSGSIGRWKKYGDKLVGLKAALGELAE